jgi:exopolysaccharide biosynthesis polyprenyl glycosylphosphotransferase
MFRNQPKFKIYLLSLDIFILLLSFFLALVLLSTPLGHVTAANLAVLLNNIASYIIFTFIILVVFFFNNLYKRNIVTTRYRQFILIIKSLVIGIVICSFVLIIYNPVFLLKQGKYIFLYFFFISLILFTLIRALPMKGIFLFLSQKNLYPQRVLIVGADEPGQQVARKLSTDRYSNFFIAGFLDDYKKVGQPVMSGYENLGRLADLDRLAGDLKIDEIIIAIHNAPYARLIQIVEACLDTGRVTRIYSDILEVVVNKINVESYAGIPLVMLSQSTSKSTSYPFKRLFDVFASLTAIIVLLPVFALIAVGIKLSSTGPVFFKQTRIGRQGRPFDFYKFRSMHTGNEDARHQEFVQNFIKEGCAEQKPAKDEIKVFKITNDPRIFPFGKFIRKTSLDEFPQFFNVLKGDMSLVGPRPCLPYEWEAYEPWHKSRLNCLPGCTGMWQALGRSTVTFKEMVLLDLYYVSNVSIFLDIRIVLNTFPVIFLGKGAF